MAPNNDGELIRLNVPALTEDRRKEILKQAKAVGEDAKVAIRNIRKGANSDVKKQGKDLSEDVAKDANNEIQKLTDKLIKRGAPRRAAGGAVGGGAGAMAKVVVSPWGVTSKHKYAASEEGKEEQAPSDGGALKPSAELIAEVERVRVRLKNSGDRWVLDPSTKHYRRWDFMTFTALVFTAVVTPVEVGFFTEIRFDALFFVNRFVDAIFISDIFIQFVLAYPDPNRGNILIKSSPMIVRRYLRTWFFIDFVSSVPFDALAMIPSATFLSQFKPLRLVRLLKLARVAKLKRILARWEAYAVFAVSYATLSVLKLSAMLAVFAHWSACLWGLAANPSFVGEDAWSWIRKRRKNMVDDLGKPTFKAGNAFHKYAASLYFSIYTMIGLGYGDVTATTHSETIVVVLIMVSSAIFWAFMIGNFCNVVQTMDAQETSYRQRMDDLNYMMEDRKFPLGLRNRCRMYLVNSKEHQRTAGYGRIEDLFSTELKGEVAATNNERWLKSIWYMSDLSYDFVIELSHNIDSMMFAPAEPINVLDSLFIIQSGIAARKGRVLPKGSVWGCDFILEDANLIDRVCAAALSYASVAYLTRDDVFQILAEPSRS
ncbi:voltage-gated potassium channel [Aureococcus anophagefferens]|nr:voltage-gated potassium channel [Aureococcus anophagefferens]